MKKFLINTFRGKYCTFCKGSWIKNNIVILWEKKLLSSSEVIFWENAPLFVDTVLMSNRFIIMLWKKLFSLISEKVVVLLWEYENNLNKSQCYVIFVFSYLFVTLYLKPWINKNKNKTMELGVKCVMQIK